MRPHSAGRGRRGRPGSSAEGGAVEGVGPLLIGRAALHAPIVSVCAAPLDVRFMTVAVRDSREAFACATEGPL